MSVKLPPVGIEFDVVKYNVNVPDVYPLMKIEAFDKQAVQGMLVYMGIVSTEVSILILLRSFKGA